MEYDEKDLELEVYKAERLQEDSETLTSVYNGLESMLTLCTDEANIPAVEACARSYGELLGDDTVSQEGIKVDVDLLGYVKENLKKVWKAIKNAVKKVYNAIKTFFLRITSGWKGIESRIVELKTALKGTGGVADSIEFTGLSKLHFDGRTSGAAILEGLEILDKTALNTTEGMLNSGIEYYDDLTKVINREEIDSLTKISNRLDDHLSLAVTVEMLGGKSFKVSYERGEIKLDFSTYDKGKGVQDTNTVPALTTTEMGRCLELLDSVAVTGKSKSGKVLKLMEAKERAIKKLDSILSRKVEDEKRRAELTRYINMVKKDLVVPVSNAEKHYFSVSRALLDYIEQSIAAYH